MDQSVVSYLRSWYACDYGTDKTLHFASPTAQQAFRDGLKRFSSDLTADARKIDLVKDATSLHDVQALVQHSFAKYSDGQKHPKARKWLHRSLSKIHHYSNVMDVMAQHHPEYVALAWGAMKLLLISAKNHEATISLISKALTQIAELLPRLELSTVLFPTERMRQAVGNLYANLIRFFIRAHDWSCESPWRHLVHSITRPVELRYDDLLNDIAADSREIDQLAAAGSRVEIREMNLKLTDIQSMVKESLSSQALHSSSLLDTNRRVSELQFSQLMSHLSNISEAKLGDPIQALRFNQYLQQHQSQTRPPEKTNRFWQSPKLQAWSSTADSRVVFVKGDAQARFTMRRFSLNVIEQLRSNNASVLWALQPPTGDSGAARASIIDVFKHLVMQALRLQHHDMTEGGMSLHYGRFHRASTEQEWLHLLGATLHGAPSQVYLIIDLSTLDSSLLPAEGFSWLKTFHDLFEEMEKRCPSLNVKVLLLGNNINIGTQACENVPSDMMVSARAMPVPARRRRHMDLHSMKRRV